MPSKNETMRAQQAKSLLENDVLAAAMNDVALRAMDELSNVDPTDTDAIREKQATIRVLKSIKDMLEEYIISGSQI